MITTIYRNAQEFIDAYAAWKTSFSFRQKRKEQCNKELHGFFLCCSEHMDLQAEIGVFQEWAHKFDIQYSLYKYDPDTDYYERHHMFCSQTWFEELAKESGCTLPSSLKEE